MNSALSFFSFWAIIGVLLWAMARTDWGRHILYYVLWLAVVLMMVTQAQAIIDQLNESGIVTINNGQ